MPGNELCFMSVISNVGSRTEERWELNIALWALVAILVYRYWPLTTTEKRDQTLLAAQALG